MKYVPKEVTAVGQKDERGNIPYTIVMETGERAFMLAKNAPEVGKEEIGEIVDAPKKSGEGTYKKFVRAKKEDYAPKGSGKDYDNEGAAWGNALSNAVLIVKDKLDVDQILEITRTLYEARKDKTVEPEESKTDENEVNIEDIPF